MSKCVSGTGQVNAGSDYTAEEQEFIAAMARFQREHRRRYPSITEYLAVLKSLGYVKQPRNDAPPA